MNLNYVSLLDENFDEASRVWVYQSSRIFSLGEALSIESVLIQFAENWKSHGTPVKGAGYLFFGQFIILMADETATGVSGCSTDSSVRLIKDIEQQFNVHLFDRTTLAFVINDKIQLLPMSQLKYAMENNYLNADTLYFNNTVQTKAELQSKWIIPIRESWLSARLKVTQ